MKRRKYNKKSKKFGRFKSGLEQTVWDKLARTKNKAFNFQYEGEKLKYFVVKHYTPDIILTFPGGKKIYVEIKGYLRYEDQVKMRAVKNSNPELDIRFVFTPNGRVGGSTMTPEQWCLKYGFECTMTGKIPTQWMKDSQQKSLPQQSLQQRSARPARKQKKSPSTTETIVPKTGIDPTASLA